MRSMFSQFGYCLAVAGLALAFTAAMPRAGVAMTSGECLKSHTALAQQKKAALAQARQNKTPVAQVNQDFDARMKAKADECLKIARAEAEEFLARPFENRWSYKKQTMADVCTLRSDSANINCRLPRVYRQCVAVFTYSPKNCGRLNGKPARPCCTNVRTR